MKELSWLLMLIPFGVVFGIGLFFFYCSWRQHRFSDSESEAESGGNHDAYPPDRSGFASSSALFERPSRWLAIRCNNPAAVQAALNLHHPVPCSWEEGLVESREDKLFVAPPVSGWVLVVGSGLPEPAEDVDFCYRFLRDLSRKLGNVQFYSVNRVLSHHAWALLEGGEVYRAYAWAGETLWNEGFVTAAEKELEMVCFEYGSQAGSMSSREAISADTEKINRLAARWSLDPAAIQQSTWKAHGIVGEFSQF
jgi:hypothetical protein